MGRWSRRLAERFIDWLGAEPNLAWLDVGCGTGALTSVICNVADPSSVVACDPSEAFVQDARRRIKDGRVTVIVAGSDDLPQRKGGFDRVVSGLVLNFLTDPRRSVEEMRARTRPGGMVAAYVWDYADRMEFLRHFWDEAAALDESARDLDEGFRFPMCRRDALESIFSAAGMRDVMSAAVEIPTRFETFNDYWRPFLGGTGPAPSYVASLSEEMLHGLRVRLERRLVPAGTGGVIELVARAWAVRGAAP
ncbi:MAG: class I SAM-dependent methyltransferase [Deltaproteobacteria bacterium]|nr:class I SAM-dependent methyltransferase [Deltaproteobacteria bacterium]